MVFARFGVEIQKQGIHVCVAHVDIFCLSSLMHLFGRVGRV